MDKVLVYCPLSPHEPNVHTRTLESIFALEWPGQMDIVFGKDDGKAQSGSLPANENITRKYNTAREMALAGGYDALMTVEADMIVPPRAMRRLSQVNADVAYGLYVSRHGGHPWLAFERVTPEIRGSRSFGKTWQEREAMLGSVVETAGVGLGCTWIWRRVLEAVPFRVEDQMVANDWYFSLDLQDRGYRQAHDCAVVCGHIEGYVTYWPDVAHGYRADEPPQQLMEDLIAMAKGKYIVLYTLSVGRDEEHPDGFAHPGSEITLDDKVAEILLKRRAIKPAVTENKQVSAAEIRIQQRR